MTCAILDFSWGGMDLPESRPILRGIDADRLRRNLGNNCQIAAGCARKRSASGERAHAVMTHKVRVQCLTDSGIDMTCMNFGPNIPVFIDTFLNAHVLLISQALKTAYFVGVFICVRRPVEETRKAEIKR